MVVAAILRHVNLDGIAERFDSSPFQVIFYPVLTLVLVALLGKFVYTPIALPRRAPRKNRQGGS